MNKNLKENKFKRCLVLPFRGLFKRFSPTLYVRLQYRYITHHKLNLINPKRYTEKLQYLRLFVYPKNDLVSQCTGRLGLREYAKKCGFEENLVKIYGVFDKFEDIDFTSLPNQFAMKCTHASGFNYLCYDKNSIDIKQLKKQFNKWLKTDYGKKTIEPHYSKIKPQIIIEELLLEDNHLPIEYKIHVFNGVAKSLYVVTSRGIDIRYNNFYIDWKPFDGSQFNGWKKADYELSKPHNFEEMVKISEILCKPFPFVRCDLYNIDGKIYISEMTFTPAKGTLILDDDKCDFEMGEWLDISSFNAK